MKHFVGGPRWKGECLANFIGGIAVLLFLLAGIAAGEQRTWTDSQGRQVEAEYLGVESGNVSLRLADGKVVPFPFQRLSAEDQAWVKQRYQLSPASAAQRIDQFVNGGLTKAGRAPNPKTTDEQFVRRAYLEIAGTIPTFDQTLDFLESEERDKRRKLIDQLLDSEGFVSHSFNWYADLLRLTSKTNDFFVYETYLQWVKDRIRENQPFDEFVAAMLTAEGRMWDDPASGYFIRDRGMPLGNLSTTVSIFLGTEITCAECHDHPFEDWTQRDFYQLAAYLGQRQDRRYGKEFGQMARTERERIETEQRKLDASLGADGFFQPFRNVVAANHHSVWDDAGKALTYPHDYRYDDAKPGDPVVPMTIFGEQVNPADYESPRLAFASWMTSKENPMFALAVANRLWKRAFGLALHEPVDNIHDVENAQNPELLAYLEQLLKDLDFDTREFLRAIYYSEAWQRQASLDGPTLVEIDGNGYPFPGPVLKRMSAQQVWDSFLTLTVPDPMRYRRDVAQAWTDAIRFDIEEVSGAESMERTRKLQDLMRKTINNGAPSAEVWAEGWGPVKDEESGGMKRFAGAYLARASEIVQPAPRGHFLRSWGQSDRNLVDNASDNGSIPQILTMINGPFTQMLIKPDSLIFQTTGSQRGRGDKMENIFLSILSRYPQGKEKAICSRALRTDEEGYGDLIWALVNTREFLFIR